MIHYANSWVVRWILLCLILVSRTDAGEELFLVQKPDAKTESRVRANFQKAMEIEAAFDNPFAWIKRKREVDAAAREADKKRREAKAETRKLAFQLFIEDEWIAGAPDAVMKDDRRQLRELTAKLEKQLSQLIEMKSQSDKAAKAAKDYSDDTKKRLDELNQKLDAQVKASADMAEAQKRAGSEIEKRIDELKDRLTGFSRRQQGEIDRLKSRLSTDFEEAEFDGVTFIRIPAGEFTMGSTPEDIAALEARGEWTKMNKVETPARTIKIDKPFWIGKLEVTQKQWKSVMDKNPSAFQGDNLPVETISWNEAQAFIEKLNKRTGGKYRLPTEAEWEYACRAGGTGLWGAAPGDAPTFENLGTRAWFVENSGDKTHAVGGKSANAWGIGDMLGNVWEWCSDGYRTDYATEGDFTERVFRGGCWALESRHIRAAFRGGNLPDYKSQYVGFRLVREIAD